MLRLADTTLDVAIDFPWWDDPERNLGGWTLDDIPLGTLEEPYSDVDQCWRILVREANGVVNVASGTAGEEGLYDIFLSVPGREYRAACGTPDCIAESSDVMPAGPAAAGGARGSGGLARTYTVLEAKAAEIVAWGAKLILTSTLGWSFLNGSEF